MKSGGLLLPPQAVSSKPQTPAMSAAQFHRVFLRIAFPEITADKFNLARTVSKRSDHHRS
jgi:hypothetical protein